MHRRAFVAPLILAAIAGVALAASDQSATADGESSTKALHQEEREQLEALGYVTWAEVDEKGDGATGANPVSIHSVDQTEKGINFYCSEPTDVAHLIDMSGNSFWTLRGVAPKPFYAHNRCKLIEIYDADTVLMLHEQTQIASMSWDSTENWSLRGRFHHDLAVDEKGVIYAYFDRAVRIPGIDADRPIIDTLIVRISGDGKALSHLPLSKLVMADPVLLARSQASPGKKPAPDAPVRPRDVFHANTLEVIERELQVAHGVLVPKGSLLISIRNLDTIAILDPKEERLLWMWGPGELEHQHDPTVLPNGNILIFDNGVYRKFSRVLELDPRSQKIVWKYQSDPPEEFYSETRGAAQRLPDGNILITDSDHGRAFEITRAGEVVWEYWNPERSLDGTKRATIFRMSRLFPAELRQLNWPAALQEAVPYRRLFTGSANRAE